MLLLCNAGKEKVGYHSWILERRIPLMMGRRRKWSCRDCSNVLGLSVSFLLVSTLENERYERWSLGCSGDV